jgi:cytochrome o ubiquinol oxidase subunit 3
MNLPSNEKHHDVSETTLFGFWLYLMSDCVMFAAFFATYIVLNSGMTSGPQAKDLFDLSTVLKQTIILLLSTYTTGKALVAARYVEKPKMVFYFMITFILGITFLRYQMDDFIHLIEQGFTWSTNGFLSAYFTLIGLHGLHIVVGLLFLPPLCYLTMKRGLTAMNARRLTCFKIYWQFLYIVWIFTFTFVYLMGAR